MWKANKSLSILLWVLSLISLAICAYIFVNADSFVKSDPSTYGPMEPMFIWVYIMIGLTVLLAVVLPIPNIISNPKSAKGLLVFIVGFVALFGISYALASDAPVQFNPGHAPVSGAELKYADVNIISTYIMLGGTLLAMLGTGIWDFIKNR